MMMLKMIIIIIMNKSQEMTVFHGRQKLTYDYEDVIRAPKARTSG